MNGAYNGFSASGTYEIEVYALFGKIYQIEVKDVESRCDHALDLLMARANRFSVRRLMIIVREKERSFPGNVKQMVSIM